MSSTSPSDVVWDAFADELDKHAAMPLPFKMPKLVNPNMGTGGKGVKGFLGNAIGGKLGAGLSLVFAPGMIKNRMNEVRSAGGRLPS